MHAAGLHVRSFDALPGQQRTVHTEMRASGVSMVQRTVPQCAAVRAQQQPGGSGSRAEPAGALLT